MAKLAIALLNSEIGHHSGPSRKLFAEILAAWYKKQQLIVCRAWAIVSQLPKPGTRHPACQTCVGGLCLIAECQTHVRAFHRSLTWRELKDLYDLTMSYLTSNFPPRTNIAPTQDPSSCMLRKTAVAKSPN